MRRLTLAPRPDWERKVEESGLIWHSPDEVYWNESAFYEFRAAEIEAIESATNELAHLTLRAVEHVIENRSYSSLGIPSLAIPLIEKSWEEEHPSLYGRFDLAYDGVNPPKLLEYNADTPTSLLEASVVQWQWLEELFPRDDQFNSIHDRLLGQWAGLAPYLPGGEIHFCSMDDAEDGMTVAYLLDTALQSGLKASLFPIPEIGWDGSSFLGPDGRTLGAVFKLYPWEWMIREPFGQHLEHAATLWTEPAWKMLLSNKAILPLLWTLNPGHPNLLPASLEGPEGMEEWVRKPVLGREGANITLHRDGLHLETEGSYGVGRFVYQQAVQLPCFDGNFPVIGSWVIGHQDENACGIGVREGWTPIIDNSSAFVPHVLR